MDTKGAQLTALLKSSGISAETFAYSAITQLQAKQELLPYVQANPGSFLVAVMRAAEQGLDFGKPNECHLVGYKDKQFHPNRIELQRGYKGWLKLARNSDGVVDVDGGVVFANDQYGRRYGAARTVDHIPPPFGADRGEMIGVYAIAFLTDGGVTFDEMPVAEVIDHAKRYTKAANYGPFAGIAKEGVNHQHFIAYALKTVVIRLCNRKLDLSSKGAQAITEELTEIEAEPMPTMPALEQHPAPLAIDIETTEFEAVDEPDEFDLKLSVGDVSGKKVWQLSEAELEDYYAKNGSFISSHERSAVMSALELFQQKRAETNADVGR